MEVKVRGLAASSRAASLMADERRLAEDRRGCYWLYIVTRCAGVPMLQEPVRDPAQLEWHEVTKVAHCYLSVDAVTRPMHVREEGPPYGGRR